MSYLPIDVWAEAKHPNFLKNVQATVEIMTDLNEEDRYALIRAIMQFARQEFEPR